MRQDFNSVIKFDLQKGLIHVMYVLLFVLYGTLPLFSQTVEIETSGACYDNNSERIFNLTGSDGLSPERNIYRYVFPGGAASTISWNNNRWEVRLSNGLLDLWSTFASAPNPPDLATGNWQADPFCGTIIRIDGSGTQNALTVPNCTYTPSNISVSGFGCFGPNGNYTPSGMENGAPKWISDFGPGNFQIVWTGAAWEIQQLGDPWSTNTTGSITNLPCSGGWSDDVGCFAAPITLSGGCGSLEPQTVAPSASVAAAPGNSITEGTSVTFTATPTNGGDTPSYQWYKNSNPVGMDSDTYTDATLADGDQIYCDVTSNDPCADPTMATSNTITMSVAPLAVEWLFFKANLENDRVLLNWQTSKEIDNFGFDIERSSDGKNWQKMDFVAAQPTNPYYEWLDQNPLKGMGHYRLKQMDFNGEWSYSKIESVKLNTTKAEVLIYPNPVGNKLNIIDGQGAATLYNALGEKIATFIFNDPFVSLPTSDLPSGVYTLQIRQVNGRIAIKQFVK